MLEKMLLPEKGYRKFDIARKNASSIVAALEQFVVSQKMDEEQRVYTKRIPLYVQEFMPRLMQLQVSFTDSVLKLPNDPKPSAQINIRDFQSNGSIETVASRDFSVEQLEDGTLLLCSDIFVAPGSVDKLSFRELGIGTGLMMATNEFVRLLRLNLPKDVKNRKLYYLYQDYSHDSEAFFGEKSLKKGESWADEVLMKDDFIFDPQVIVDTLPQSPEELGYDPGVSRLKVFLI